MRAIAGLPKLEKLSAFDMSFQEEAVKELGASKSLREIDLLSTNVMKVGVKALQEKLPKCKISSRNVVWEIPPPPTAPE